MKAIAKKYYIQEDDMDHFISLVKRRGTGCIRALCLDETDLGKKTAIATRWLCMRRNKIYEIADDFITADLGTAPTICSDKLQLGSEIGAVSIVFYSITEVSGGIKGAEILGEESPDTMVPEIVESPAVWRLYVYGTVPRQVELKPVDALEIIEAGE